MSRIIIQWQDPFGHWQRFQEMHNQAEASRTAQARTCSSGRMQRSTRRRR